MDLSYKDYTERQLREVKSDKLLERALMLRPSGNYRRAAGGPLAGQAQGRGWVPQAYPGFAVISMVDENERNDPGMLEKVQQDLLEACPWEESIYLLPADSFHQTVANTLSEQRFLKNIQQSGLEPVYPDLVARAFARLPSLPDRVLPMRLVGVGIFGTALGALGIFDSEENYQRILDFRAGFYADTALSSHDIRMTRPFIGHITLAYIESDLSSEQRRLLAQAVYAINRDLASASPVFDLSLTGLRRYHDLSAFSRQDDYPRYHL